MTAFDLIIFDNDGVLVDSESHAGWVIVDLLAEYGLPLSYDEVIHLFMGTSMPWVREYSEARLGRALPDDFEQRYHDDLFARFRRELRPVAGVEKVLDGLSVPACVASNGVHKRMRLTLELTGLLPRFDGRLFSAEDVERSKPAPDLFLYAAQMMGSAPPRCAVIEDSPHGIEAANAAGMTSFGYTGMTPPERLREATGGVFSTMEELPDLLASFGK